MWKGIKENSEMAKKVLIISTSFRGGSNSEILAKKCEKGFSGWIFDKITQNGRDYYEGRMYCMQSTACISGEK